MGTAALECRPGDFEFAYERATVVDRNPTAGDISFIERFADLPFRRPSRRAPEVSGPTTPWPCL